MSRRFLSLTLSGFLIVILINWSCTKLDTTNIGSDLIPTVDNITTFADTLSITTTQGIFADSTRLALTDNYAVGKLNDPLFGQTEATLFLQLKPPFYPYYIGLPNDTIISIDSLVLCLAFTGVYGDTSASFPITLQVNEVSQNAHDAWDSLETFRPISYAPEINTTLLSNPVTIDLATARSYRKIGKGTDSVINQVRIPITNSMFINRLFGADSLLGGEFSRDSLFRAFTNGFAVSATGSTNAILYTQLSDAATRLELHYKRKNNGFTDTSMSTFTFNTGAGGNTAPRRSAVADHIVRTLPNLGTGEQVVYLETAPGTYANLKIPGLSGYTNRIIHRAEIMMEQIPADPVTDGYFNQPDFLYLDLIDSGTAKWKPIYFDLNPSTSYNPDDQSGLFLYYPSTEEVDFTYFGGKPKTSPDPSGTRKSYSINISRYVQQLVTKQTPNYEMRLFAPHNILYPQYETTPTTIPYVNNIVKGRVRLGGGNNVNPEYRMRLRVIYSNLK